MLISRDSRVDVDLERIWRADATKPSMIIIDSVAIALEMMIGFVVAAPRPERMQRYRFAACAIHHRESRIKFAGQLRLYPGADRSPGRMPCACQSTLKMMRNVTAITVPPGRRRRLWTKTNQGGRQC
jgi:hypothetical protein